MIYRSFKDKKISALGFGTMRLPLKNGNFAEPDEDAAAVMFDTAIKGGVNYFDTACRYCTSHCPKHLDIPELLRLYNEHKFTGGGFLAPMALSAMPADKQPRECIGCRSCEKVCPQNIKISEAMRNFTEILG